LLREGTHHKFFFHRDGVQSSRPLHMELYWDTSQHALQPSVLVRPCKHISRQSEPSSIGCVARRTWVSALLSLMIRMSLRTKTLDDDSIVLKYTTRVAAMLMLWGQCLYVCRKDDCIYLFFCCSACIYSLRIYSLRSLSDGKGSFIPCLIF